MTRRPRRPHRQPLKTNRGEAMLEDVAEAVDRGAIHGRPSSSRRYFGARGIRSAITALLVLFATSCGEDGPTSLPPPVETSIMISPESSTLVAVGETVQLTARVLDQNGWPMTQATVTWSVSEASVASVDATGLVTAVANGTANVTAAAGGASGSASVTVRQQAVELRVSPAADTLNAPGDTLRLTAGAYDAGGHGIPSLKFVWSSSSESVATVDSTGLVTAAGRGLVEILARAVGDGAGDQAGSATVLVNRDRFLGPPQFDPNILPVNTVTPIRVQVAIAPTEGLDVAEVAVFQVEENGAELDVRIPLYDNGDPANGDDALGDGIYSNFHTITPPPATAGLLRFRAAARGHLDGEPVRDRSLVAALTVVKPATSEQIDEMIQTQAAALDSANQVLGATSDIASALSTAEEFLRAHPAVAAVSRAGDTGINLTYTSGLLGGIIFAYTDENGTVTTRGGQLASRTDRVDRSRPPPSNARPVVAAGERAPASARPGFAPDPDTEHLILSDKVLLFEPFADEFAPHNEGDDIKKLVEERLGLEVDRYEDFAATVEVLRRMKDYGLVVLATHGLDGEWILTRTVVNDQTKAKYAAALAANKLGAYTHADVIENVKFKWNYDVYGVNSSFVEGLAGAFPQSVIINNSCQSTETSKLWNAFEQKGAHTYYGYDKDVSSLFAVSRAVEVVEALTRYKTTGEAFRPGQKDPRSSKAEFEIRGDSSMRFGVDSVNVTPPTATLAAIGDMVTLMAVALDANGHEVAGPEFAWSSDDNAVATVDTVGVVTAVANGTATVTATADLASGSALVLVRVGNDRAALEAFYEATNGADWRLNVNWLTDVPLGDWYGVDVDHNGRVTSLGGSSNNLSGFLPPELGQLSQLRSLDLSSNQLTGPIPPELGQLSQLRSLDLRSNQLAGPIPPELGQLSQLERLLLGHNQLAGPIPPELGQLSQLEWLFLGYNQLAGPVPPELGQLSQLRSLDLSGWVLRYNQLTGPIPPELGQLSQLRSLNLRYNQLTGPIPPELGQLSQLRSLNLRSNQLAGPIPPELGQLSQVKGVDLARNRLSGCIPPLVSGNWYVNPQLRWNAAKEHWEGYDLDHC